ncbi:SDR family oxidoreductase [Rhodococcus artemisiae]|uniref:NAD(P)H-binding protein n=1 Tax=Rhodococcus artemisiae TaxID=714159 RepID=A0ABU7LHE2_9NOCA|nr:NAD(P)H-binding protein [Rhodococcus artemisiae]MEE2060978.1 NAD(P)H-binding protein [Rhodococcus artemisiae]
MNATSPIVVTGGTGTVGHHVVERLLGVGHQVRVVSRHDRSGDTRSALEWAVADLVRDDGIERALTGADTVVHCATGYSRRADVRAARHLFSAARVAGIEHVVLISIVGVDRIPFGYYTGKVEVEHLLERSGLGYSILRSTQFHELVAGLFTRQRRLPVLLTPDIRIQPIAAAEVADELARLAAAPPAGRVPEVGGPDIIDARDLARTYAASIGARKRIWPIRLPGRAFAAFRAGNNLTPERAVGVRTFREYLTLRP